MICTYELHIVAACPLDGKPDVYCATITAEKTILVENILAAIERYRTEKSYQEDITAELARSLGCNVKTVGHHSGVRTTVEAP